MLVRVGTWGLSRRGGWGWSVDVAVMMGEMGVERSNECWIGSVGRMGTVGCAGAETRRYDDMTAWMLG